MLKSKLLSLKMVINKLSQNMKRLPKNSITIIFKFPTKEDRDKFVENDKFKISYGNLNSLANKCNVKKIEAIPNP